MNIRGPKSPIGRSSTRSSTETSRTEPSGSVANELNTSWPLLIYRVRAMSTERPALPSLELNVFMCDETTLDEPTLVVLGAFHLADLSRDGVWCGSMLGHGRRVPVISPGSVEMTPL